MSEPVLPTPGLAEAEQLGPYYDDGDIGIFAPAPALRTSAAVKEAAGHEG